MARAGLPGPTGAWVTLGALARETSRIRLGTLLSSAASSAGGTAGEPAGGPAGEPAAGPFSFTRLRLSRRTDRRPIPLHPPTARLVRRVATANCALGP